jgi:hypothetical protein
MSEPLPPPSLSRAREQKINELSDHFAADDLTLEDLERRIEQVYKAASVADLDLITADLRSAAPLVAPRGSSRRDRNAAREVAPTADLPANYEIPHSRLLAIMSSTRRTGRWAVPRDLSMFAMMSDTKLDLTTAALPVGGVVNIEITAVMAAVKIIVAPGMRVVNELHSFMAEVRSNADEMPTEGLTPPGMPVIRLTGTAFMAEVKVRVRHREEPIYDDEE